MTKEELINKIHFYLAKGEIEKSIKLGGIYLDKKDFILLYSRYSRAKKDYNKGLVSQENHYVELNRITESLLVALDGIENEKNIKKKRNQFVIWLALSGFFIDWKKLIGFLKILVSIIVSVFVLTIGLFWTTGFEDNKNSNESTLELNQSYNSVSVVIKKNLHRTVFEDMDEVPNNIIEEIELALGSKINLINTTPGDRFSLIYDKRKVNGVQIDSCDLIAIKFIHNETPYYSFRFEDCNNPGFYDEKGINVSAFNNKSPLKLVVPNSKEDLLFLDSLKFTESPKFHPILKRSQKKSIRFSAPYGTPIHSISDGHIQSKGRNRGDGNYLKIEYDSSYIIKYTHMSQFADIAKLNSEINKGDIIGYIGTTGLATYPHVCIYTSKNGIRVDKVNEKNLISILNKKEQKKFQYLKNKFLDYLKDE